MKNIAPERQFLINRLGYLRNRAGLSARELSGRMDKSDAYIAKFENGKIKGKDVSIIYEKNSL